MTSKIKNIILFTTIAALLILAYVFFIKSDRKEETSLISSSSSNAVDTTFSNMGVSNSNVNTSPTSDFLPILLSVTNIKLDDSIFSDEAFTSLRDTTILLTPTGDEGRPNPFAPIGYEAAKANLQNASATPSSFSSF